MLKESCGEDTQSVNVAASFQKNFIVGGAGLLPESWGRGIHHVKLQNVLLTWELYQ